MDVVDQTEFQALAERFGNLVTALSDHFRQVDSRLNPGDPNRADDLQAALTALRNPTPPATPA